MKAELNYIGHIKTPYKSLEECPRNINPNGPICQIVVDRDFVNGILGLSTGERILILYWLENTNRNATRQKSGRNGEMMGTFALRSPHRPNPIGAAVVTIETIENRILYVKGLDCLDGTPLIDIKPAIMLEA